MTPKCAVLMSWHAHARRWRQTPGIKGVLRETRFVTVVAVVERAVVEIVFAASKDANV